MGGGLRKARLSGPRKRPVRICSLMLGYARVILRAIPSEQLLAWRRGCLKRAAGTGGFCGKRFGRFSWFSFGLFGLAKTQFYKGKRGKNRFIRSLSVCIGRGKSEFEKCGALPRRRYGFGLIDSDLPMTIIKRFFVKNC